MYGYYIQYLSSQFPFLVFLLVEFWFQHNRYHALALVVLNLRLGRLRPLCLRKWTARMTRCACFIGRFERYLDLLVFFNLYVVRI